MALFYFHDDKESEDIKEFGSFFRNLSGFNFIKTEGKTEEGNFARRFFGIKKNEFPSIKVLGFNKSSQRLEKYQPDSLSQQSLMKFF